MVYIEQETKIFFIGEKIIALRKCVGEPKFTYTDFNCYVSATFYIIKTKRTNLKYLTALLNSKMIAFWLKNKGKMQGNNYQLDKEPLLEIPIFNPPNTQECENIVYQILTLKSEGKDTTILEQQIDNLVYKLYELTYEEVKIIDPEFALSEKEYEKIKP
jgi:adenine-specific DNA-methyltransferase